MQTMVNIFRQKTIFELNLNIFFFWFSFCSVHEIGDTQDDQEARALLNKFLGASILMSGVESSMASSMSSSYEKLPNVSTPH
jgi:hypothetical protein